MTNADAKTLNNVVNRRNDFKKSSREVKFFTKVVMPLIEKYFSHHRAYFTAVATATTSAGARAAKTCFLSR
jgi:ryanodine receptor 2